MTLPKFEYIPIEGLETDPSVFVKVSMMDLTFILAR